MEIVFESCDNIKPKILNGRVNNNRTKEEQDRIASTSKSTAAATNQHLNESQIINEFTFEIHRELCGLLIGTKGSFINTTMRNTNTSISLKNHPVALNLNLCSIKGSLKSINEALAIIRVRFPLKRFPQLTLIQVPNIMIEPISEASHQLHLPEGVSCEVVLSNFITPNHLFLQQPTHPTFTLLQSLDQYMISTYKFNDAPGVDELAIGIICAVQKGEGWFRAIVTDIIDHENCVVKLLDYGGMHCATKSQLRQVKRDYMSIPFQAVECYLSNVEPANGVWSEEAINFFKEIASEQILQSFTISYTEQRIPKIQLYRIVQLQPILINKELCVNGFANWVD